MARGAGGTFFSSAAALTPRCIPTRTRARFATPPVRSFRYISVEGLTGIPPLTGLVTGLHFHSATPPAGALAFPASANTLNQLQHAIVWTQASNIMGNPTDCPQRDER